MSSGNTIPAVGIDLGTTYSVIAAIDEHGAPASLRSAEGENITPSAAFFDGRDVVVGKEALKALSIQAENVVLCPKRDMGSRFYHRKVAGLSYPPQVLQAYILDKLRRDAQQQLGPFQKVVITVPAYFDEARRKATQEAGYMAGFEVIDIINEPTAAAVAFGYRRGWMNKAKKRDMKECVLVYDLGGGTFDVTVMEISGEEFKTLSIDGDVQLGGRDWDQRLMDYVAERVVRSHRFDPRDEPNLNAKLWRECEDAKRTLSVRQSTRVAFESRGSTVAIDITREQFDDLTRDLLDRTSLTVRQALHAANVSWDQIDRVLLIGGSTRMPAVQQMLRSQSGKEPDCSISPDEAVAFGAALHAQAVIAESEGRIPQFRLRNVNAHSLGVVGTHPSTGQEQNVIIVPRNTRLPVTLQRTFRTQQRGQTSVLVRIVEGEVTSPNDCVQLGQLSIYNLPSGLPAKSPIEVFFHYKSNGRLTVSVKMVGLGARPSLQIARENSLSKGQLGRWRQLISGMAPLPES